MNLKDLSNRLSHRLLMLLGFVSKRLNINGRNTLGRIMGRVIKLISKKRADITINNIRNAFPEYSDSQCNTISVQAYENLGITLAELLAFPVYSNEDFNKYVKFENIDLVKKKITEGKGLIFISGHFGNWELMAYCASLALEIPITIVVKPQRNKFSDKYLNDFRTKGGNKIVPMGNAARTIINAIRNKEAIALLVDQSADASKDVFVPFFGRLASTYEAPAVIALKYRTPIITGFAHRQPDNTYKVVIKELDFSDLDDSKESIKELTRRHVKVLEDNIRMNPGQWSWQHKRWKHTPQANIK